MTSISIRKQEDIYAEKQDPGGTADSYTLVLIKWRQGAWQPSMINIPGFKSWAAANAQGLQWKNYAHTDLQERHDYHIVAVS